MQPNIMLDATDPATHMRTLKALVILMVVWTCSPRSLFADLLTFRIAGTVGYESTGGSFRVGRPCTLTVTIDTLSPKSTVVPERGDYLTAITSFTFNYDSGAYTAQVQNNGSVNVWNDDRGLYDHFQIFGLGGFPPVAGQTHSGTYVSLTDTSAVVFASTDLPRDLKADDFQLRSFHINWGIDWETRIVSLTVESIALVERRPEITAWAVSTNALILEITFPSQPYTNILQRSFQLGPSAQWDTVTAFVSSGGKTNWPVSLQTELPMRFYRMRPQ